MTRHHYVPQMYLKRFADGEKRVVVVERDDLAQSEVLTVKQAMQLDNFYGWDTGAGVEDVEDPAVLDPEYVENLLSVFESRAATVLDRLAASGQPPTTVKDRYHLNNFIALQAARGQRFRADLRQAATLAMRRYLRANHDPAQVRDWLAERGEPHGPEDIRAFVERVSGPDGPRLVPHQAIEIQQALRFAMRNVGPTLWMRSWTVVTFDEACLLTSDEPVVALHPEDEPVTAMTAPLLLMALDRRHLLVMRQTEPFDEAMLKRFEDVDDDEPPADESNAGPVIADGYARGGPEQAVRYNSLVATQAERHIVHHPDDAALLEALVLGPRTAWGEEVLETTEEGDTVTVRSRARRLPVD